MVNIDIKRVQYFLTLCGSMNFSDTAKTLGISQPGLTKAINQLERDVGATLLRREGRNTHLTPVGLAALDHFQRLVNVAQDVDGEIQKLAVGAMPVLKIGVMCTIGSRLLGSFLSKFQKSQDDLEIVLSVLTASELAGVILSGDVDVAIVGADVNCNHKLKYRELYKEPMVVATALDHRFAKDSSVGLTDLNQEPYIDRLQCEFRDTFLLEAAKRDFSPKFVARSESEEWVRALVAEGAGVSVVPKFSIFDPRVASIELTDIHLERTVSLAIPYGREDTKAVVSLVRAAAEYDWSAVQLSLEQAYE